MNKLILSLFVLAATPVFAQPTGSGSAPGSAAPAAGSTPAPAGSGSAPAPAGSGSAPAGSGSDAAGSGSAPVPPPPPSAPEPSSGARAACAAALNADEKFAESVIFVAEQKLARKLDSEQVLKDLCTIRHHQASQDEVATNKRHVLMAYIAMWLVAAGFVIYLWRKQQALKLEIAKLRADLDAAAKDGK